MLNIARNILHQLGLTPSLPKSGRSANPAHTGGAVDVLAPSKRSRQAAAGLSVREAVAQLKSHAHLPARARGQQQVMETIIESIAPAERSSVVEACIALLPPGAHAAVANAVVGYLTTLPRDERKTLAASTTGLVGALRLPSRASADDYLKLLQEIHGLPAERRASLLGACWLAQGNWRRDLPAGGWSHLLTALAALPAADLSQCAHEIQHLYTGSSIDPTSREQLPAFLSCVTRHLALNDEGRAALMAACNRLFPAASRQHTERQLFASSLLEIQAEQWAARGELLADLLEGLQMEAMPWVLREAHSDLLRPLQSPEERREIIDAIQRSFPAPRDSSQSWLLARTLALIPRAERSEAVPLLRALADREALTHNEVSRLVLHATPEARRDHLARLRRAAQATQPAAREGGAEDLENVMQGALQRQVARAEASLRARLGRGLPVPQALVEMERYLVTLQQSTKALPDHILQRQRGGDSEIGNALRTLVAPRRRGDFSAAVTKTPEMASLCALVWHATSAPRPGVDPGQAAQDTELMRHGVVMALARCVEDDGHRVCGVGQRQYLVDALKGYYAEAGDAQASVTPRSLVTALTADFYASHQDGDGQPTADQVSEFTTRARQVALERYGADTAELGEFHAQFDAYMRMTY